MALITRLSRLFQADFHAVLDSIEEPDIQLKQAIREMEFELQQAQQAVALLQHENQQLDTRILESKKKIASLDEELDICFKAGKDDLARDLIRRKLETDLFRQAATSRSGEVAMKLEKRQQRIAEHQQQLDNMKQKLELLVTEAGSNSSAFSSDVASQTIRNEDIEIAFLREKQMRAKS